MSRQDSGQTKKEKLKVHKATECRKDVISSEL